MIKKIMFAFAIGVLSLASTAQAVDGATEISSVTHINQPGSYVLVNDINVPLGMGMWILASDVTLDLNGFTIRHGGGRAVDGLVIKSTVSNIEVKNGSIVGFSRYGIFAPAGPNPEENDINVKLTNLRVINNGSGIAIQSRAGSHIEDCLVANSEGIGIRVGNASLLKDNVVQNNSTGLFAPSTTAGYQSNVFSNNSSSDVSGGTNLGNNLCSGVICP